MRVLITGGFGFIGGRLADYLLKAGHQIVIGSQKLSNPSSRLEKAEVVQMIWDNDIALERSCSGIDVIIHAAGINAQDCVINPEAALEFNGDVTTRFLEAASKAGVSRFIYLSTAHVYSDPLSGLITEKSLPSNPHPYATSNLAGDLAVISANQLGKIQGVVLRISNSFGAPMSKDVNCWMLLVNDLCRQVVLTHKMVLKSNGIGQRDFISMTQVCQAIELLAFDDHESRESNLYNLGSGKSQTVMSMAELIQQRCIKILGFKPIITTTEVTSDLNSLNSKLIYSIDLLLALGIKFKKEQKVEEINDLLRFCQSNFTLK